MNKTRLGINIILSMVIIWVSVRYLNQIYQPTILEDEFAYIGIAKYLSGTDWSSVMSWCKYYSYGYSLILVPLTALVKNPVWLYRSIIMLNGCILVVAFWFADSILRQLAIRWNLVSEKRASDWRFSALAFFATMMPCYMNYASVAMAECLLLLEFFVIVWLLLKLESQSSVLRSVVLGCVTIASYVTHQRTIAVVVAVTLVIFLMGVLKKIKWLHAWAYVGVLGSCIFAHRLFKSAFKTQLWKNSIISKKNDVSGATSSLKYVCSDWAHFKEFLEGISGKLFYFGSATYVLGIVAVFVLLYILLKKFRKKKEFDGIAFFLLSSFIMGFIIDAIYMHSITMLSTLVYGRYMESYMPLLWAIGFLFVITKFREKWMWIICGIGGCSYVGSALMVKYLCDRRNLHTLNYISEGHVYRYLKEEQLHVLEACGWTLAVGALLVGLTLLSCKLKDYKIINGSIIGVIFVGMLVWNLQTAHIPMKDVNLELQKTRHETAFIADDIMQACKEYDTDVVYYIQNDAEQTAYSQYREYVQYWLDDKQVLVVEWTKADQIPKQSLVVVNQVSLDTQGDNQEYEFMSLAFGNRRLTQLYKNDMCSVFFTQD